MDQSGIDYAPERKKKEKKTRRDLNLRLPLKSSKYYQLNYKLNMGFFIKKRFKQEKYHIQNHNLTQSLYCFVKLSVRGCPRLAICAFAPM